MRFVTHNDGPEEIRTGDPRLVAVSVVQDAIERSLKPPRCPQCRSRNVRDKVVSTGSHRGGTWVFSACLDCELVYDFGQDT